MAYVIGHAVVMGLKYVDSRSLQVLNEDKFTSLRRSFICFKYNYNTSLKLSIMDIVCM